MPPVKKKKDKNILEGFTYEEIPSENVEIPKEVIDNSVIIDMKDLQTESTEPKEVQSPVSSIVLDIKEESAIEKTEEKPKKSSNTVELNLPELKEEKKVISKRRNRSRRINLGGSTIDLDKLELPESITIDYKSYAGLVQSYMYRAFLLQLMAILRDTSELTNQEMVSRLRVDVPNILRLIINKILDDHKMIEDIVISFQVILDEEKEEDQSIILSLETIVKFPEHVKTYETRDFITIPV